jgi:hypothetical protein
VRGIGYVYRPSDGLTCRVEKGEEGCAAGLGRSMLRWVGRLVTEKEDGSELQSSELVAVLGHDEPTRLGRIPYKAKLTKGSARHVFGMVL